MCHIVPEGSQGSATHVETGESLKTCGCVEVEVSYVARPLNG